MAEHVVNVSLTPEVTRKLEEVTEEIRAAKEALSEACIRELIREEIAEWEKRQLIAIRMHTGYRPMELK